MSREDEVRTTAHNVLHVAFRPKSVRHKDCSARTFAPHREAAHADLEEKHDPRGSRRIVKVNPSEAKRRDTNPVSVELPNEIRDGKMKGSKR
jgi:hypothetical protein